MTGWTRTSVRVDHEIGLHARPSVKLTKLAKSFSCNVEVAVANDGPWINCKSIVKVMAMRVRKGAVLHVRARGEGAEAAIAAITDLVARNFDEDTAHAVTG
jgi:phosphocarrier protein HPr